MLHSGGIASFPSILLNIRNNWRRTLRSTCVIYWPSTEPSIKRCICENKRKNRNRCLRSKISEYHLDLWTWLNSVQKRTPTGSRWMTNNYITRCHRQLELFSSESSSQFEFQSLLKIGCPRSENQLQAEGMGPQDPRLSSPDRVRKKCCYGQKNLGSICSSLFPSPTHLSHTTNINPFATLSRIKWERYIFIKKRVRFVHWSSSSCFCLHLVPSASFLFQLKTVFSDFIIRSSKHVVYIDDEEVWG